MINERLLTEREAADFLSTPARTLGYWRAVRKGPAFIKLNQRRVRYRLDDLEAFIAERRVEPIQTAA